MVEYDWHKTAQAYLLRLGAAEYDGFIGSGGKGHYTPSAYHRELIEALNDGDENEFKGLVRMRGEDSALGEDFIKHVAEGNPGNVPLHESLADIADWVGYEAEVVKAAAGEIEDKDISDAAVDQAEAMTEASAALTEASKTAAETAAEAFVEDGTPAVEKAGEDNPEGQAVGGNPVGWKEGPWTPFELDSGQWTLQNAAHRFKANGFGGVEEYRDEKSAEAAAKAINASIDGNPVSDYAHEKDIAYEYAIDYDSRISEADAKAFADWYEKDVLAENPSKLYPIEEYFTGWLSNEPEGLAIERVLEGNPRDADVETQLKADLAAIDRLIAYWEDKGNAEALTDAKSMRADMVKEMSKMGVADGNPIEDVAEVIPDVKPDVAPETMHPYSRIWGKHNA